MADLLCINELEGLGVPCEQLTPLTGLKMLALARPGFAFDDAEDFATLASWLTAIATKDIVIIQNVRGEEDQKVEDGIYVSTYGDKIFTRAGQRGKRLMFTLTLDQHKIAQSYSDRGWTLLRGDRNNNIAGMLNEDGSVSGFNLSYFHVYDQLDGNETNPAFTPIEFQEEDPAEFNANGCYISPSWRLKSLVPPMKVLLACTAVAAFKFTATLAYVPASKFESDGTAVSIPLTGLETAASWKVVDQGGALETVTAVESAVTPGSYLITGVDITSGTCQVVTTAADPFESNEVTLSA